MAKDEKKLDRDVLYGSLTGSIVTMLALHNLIQIKGSKYALDKLAELSKLAEECHFRDNLGKPEKPVSPEEEAMVILDGSISLLEAFKEWQDEHPKEPLERHKHKWN